jgi:hypothetical protein
MSAQRETRSFEVQGFDHVRLSHYLDVTLIQGDHEGLEIEGEVEALDKLSVTVKNRQLVVEIGRDWLERLLGSLLSFLNQPLHCILTVKELRGVHLNGRVKLSADALTGEALELDVNGLGEIAIAALRADSVTMDISGRGEIDLSGEVGDTTVRITGSGAVRAAELASDDAKVVINGQGNVDLQVADTLDVHISGMGRVRYHGEPEVTRQVTGMGSVEPAES